MYNLVAMLRGLSCDVLFQVVYGLIALNVGVFALWRFVPEAFMITHFTTSIVHMRQRRWYTLLTSTFSHASALHLGFNMFALFSFAPAVSQVRQLVVLRTV
jgi:rhomboid-like protein